MDGINALLAGTARAQAQFQVAAEKIALGGLPTELPTADGQVPAAPLAVGGIDVAEQLTTMMLASGTHKATTAALRSALAMYQVSLELFK